MSNARLPVYRFIRRLDPSFFHQYRERKQGARDGSDSTPEPYPLVEFVEAAVLSYLEA